MPFGEYQKVPTAIVGREGPVYVAASPEYNTATSGATKDEALKNLAEKTQLILYNTYGQVPPELPEFDVIDNTGD